MGVASEFLTSLPRRADGKRNWPAELKARIVEETLIDGETDNTAAKGCELTPSTVSEWWRMERQTGVADAPLTVYSQTSLPMARNHPHGAQKAR